VKRPDATPLDPIQVAAATLASLPDMTHRRLRVLVERGGGPVGALAGLERGLAAAVLCDGATADMLPARQSLARAWQGGGARRSHRAHARRATNSCLRRRTAGYPLDEELPERPEVLLAEGDAPEALGPTRSPSSGRARRRRTGSTTRGSSAPC